MADKDQVYPLSTANGRGRSDEESVSNLQAKELRRKKTIKYVGYAVAFIVFQTIVITIFALTVLRIKTPEVKLRSVTVQNLNPSNATSFNLKLSALVTVKNKNFGHYKFDNSTITVSYGGTQVGEALILKGQAKAKKTRKMDVSIDVTSDQVSGNSNLSSDLSGNLTLTSYAELTGKVKVMMMIKKRKIAKLKCSMIVNIPSQSVYDLKCE